MILKTSLLSGRTCTVGVGISVQMHALLNCCGWLSVAIPAAIYRSAPGPGPESPPQSAF